MGSRRFGKFSEYRCHRFQNKAASRGEPWFLVFPAGTVFGGHHAQPPHSVKSEPVSLFVESATKQRLLPWPLLNLIRRTVFFFVFFHR
jgi:hypothetical protein